MRTLVTDLEHKASDPARDHARSEPRREHPLHHLQHEFGNQALQHIFSPHPHPDLPIIEAGHPDEKAAEQNAEIIGNGENNEAPISPSSEASTRVTPPTRAQPSLSARGPAIRRAAESETGATHGASGWTGASTAEVQSTSSSLLPSTAGGYAGRGPSVGSHLGPGSPLPAHTRRFFEQRFKHDLGGVKIYADERAARFAGALHARAYTVGSNIVFGRNAYRPDSTQGQRLLAHELTHVMQQPAAVRPCRNAAERRAVARLEEDYAASVQRGDWPRAALLLNGYNDADIRARVQRLDPRRRVNLYAGALESIPTFHQRVTDAISALDADARRVGELIYNYNTAVAQGAWTRAAELLNAFNDADIRERLALLSPGNLQLIRTGAGNQFNRIVVAADALTATRALTAGLERIRGITTNTTPDNAARQIQEALQGVNLRNRRNIEQVIAAIGTTFRGDSGVVLAAFFSRLGASAPRREPTEADVEREQRMLSLMQVQRRGPYGQVGPGLLIPELSQVARPLLPLFEGAANVLTGAEAFVSGMIDGLSGSLNDQQRTQLYTRLTESAVLSGVFAPVFLSGTVVGVIEDVIEAVKGLYQLITNFSQFVDAISGFARAMIGPDSAAIGRAVGLEMGRSYGAQIAAMAGHDVVRFTFDLGRMIGPTIVYIILAFVGVPELVVASIVERLLPILRPLLERFPRLLRIVEALAVRVRERSARTIVGRIRESRRAAAAGAVDARIQAILARIPAAVGNPAIQTTTFEAAIAANLRTEGLSIARVMRAVPASATEFRELYRIAYNGMNNREIWEAVLREIAREAERVTGPPFARPEITSRYTQAIWNIAERRGRRATLPARRAAMNVIEPGQEFLTPQGAFGRRFLDLGVASTLPDPDIPHGWAAHMTQDLVVDRAFQNAGRYVDAERFRGMLGQFTNVDPSLPGNAPLRAHLWAALYDSNTGRLNSPETVTEMMRAAFGGINPD